MSDDKQPVKKMSIIVSRGSLDGIYPALIMANGARMEGIEASLFFTFFGLNALAMAETMRIARSLRSILGTRASSSVL